MVHIDGIELIDNKYLQIDIEQHPDLAKPILDKLNNYPEIEIDEEYFNEHWGKGYTADEFFDKLTNSIKEKFKSKEGKNGDLIK